MSNLAATTPEGVELNDYDLHARYNDMLDDCYPVVSIAGHDYATSRVLRQVDPIAYRCGFYDWFDSEVQGGNIIEL